jgi:hypothetical protein
MSGIIDESCQCHGVYADHSPPQKHFTVEPEAPVAVRLSSLDHAYLKSSSANQYFALSRQPRCVPRSFWASQPVSPAQSARTTCQMVTARSRTARTDVALALQASPRHVKKPLLVKPEPVSPSFYFKGSITQQNGKHRAACGR